MSTEQRSFSLGLTYWPRRTGQRWWSTYDRGETREELAHVATLGCDTVRFCLRWEDFQPGARRLNSGALRALEHALDAASDAGLRVVAVLFPVAIGATLSLPAWANEDDPLDALRRTGRLGPTVAVQPESQPALLYGDAYHPNQARDLFSDPSVQEAQRYLVREVAGYFGAHPALWAWQLGEGLEHIRKPDSADAIYEWFASMGEVLRQQHAGARLLGVTSARGLTLRAGPRPEHLAETCDLVGVASDPPQPLPGQRPLHTVYVAYLHALTATLGGTPVIATSVGLPTAPSGRAGWIADSAYGRSFRTYLADDEQQAEFVGTTLRQLHEAGARGAWLAAYADQPPALWRTPPLDRAIRERTLGLVDADGREKPAAAVVRTFAAQVRARAHETRPAVSTPLEVDTERYWHAPKQLFVELWKEFNTGD